MNNILNTKPIAGYNKISRSNAPENVDKKNSPFRKFILDKIERIWEWMKSLIGGLKYLAPSMLFRKVYGSNFSIDFSELNTKDKGLTLLLDEFTAFDVHNIILTDKPPLTPAQMKKGEELINADHSQARHIRLLFEKSKQKKFRRFDFTADDWRALNAIDFELIKKHFEVCADLFNSPRFDESIAGFQDKTGVDFKEAWIAEVLAKSVAPLVNFDGKEILLPVPDKDGIYSLIPFSMNQRYVGDELPYYLLESRFSTVRPRIVIRGTDAVTPSERDGTPFKKGAKESLMADVIDSEGIARGPILKALHHRYDAEESLTELMNRFFNSEQEPILIGHSLGGYLASDIAVHFPDKFHRVYSFSSPGVPVETARKWRSLPKETQDKMIHFDTDGDLIPAAGLGVIGIHIAVKPSRKPHIDAPPHYHVMLNLNKPSGYQLIDNEKEEKRKARKIAESGRKIGGILMRWHLRKKPELVPDWHRRRSVYRKGAACI